HQFPCENCGSDYRYAPGTDTLTCDHCGDTSTIAETGFRSPAIRELDFRAALQDQLPEAEIEEIKVVSCPNCAAQVEFEEGMHATECPFCATPVVTGTGTHRHIKPRGVLPFGFDENTARKAMITWLGRLWFAPGGLQGYARKGRKMQGIYVPYWTFDAKTKSSYKGQRGTIYYVSKTVVRNGKRIQQNVAKVRWRSKSGRVARFFDDVLVLASASLPKRFTDALEPWDLSELEPYRPEYLAGFRAEGYGVELSEGFVQARSYMDRVIARDVKFDIGGDRQRIHAIDTVVRDVTFKHILLPVWLAAYKYRGKTYRFVVNGRTGQVQGERPYSSVKIAFAIIFGLLLAAVGGYMIALNQ
ncbi:MAG: primosomal protein N' (replication factor Y) - superfamily II helicase, partial [Paracoccaceae bacterium]